jgi:hypothetical protein
MNHHTMVPLCNNRFPVLLLLLPLLLLPGAFAGRAAG